MKLRPIRKEDLTRKPIVATGSQLVDTIEIDPRDVYIPLLREGVARNAVRTKLDQEHIFTLKAVWIKKLTLLNLSLASCVMNVRRLLTERHTSTNLCLVSTVSMPF